MSIEPEVNAPQAPSGASEHLDLTGLPAPVADHLRKLVATLRESLSLATGPHPPVAAESPDQWSRRLKAWVDTHPARSVTIADDREDLYAGRGE